MTKCRKGLVAAALLASTALALPSVASAETPAPKFTSIDQHSVDLTSGLPWLQLEEGGIGSGPGRVAMQRIYAGGAGLLDNWSGGLYQVTSGGVTKAYVQIAGISDTFTGSGSSWTADKANGATLTVDGATGRYIYTGRDGTRIEFMQAFDSEPGSGFSFWVNNCPGADPATCQVPLTITRPDGLKFTLGWPTAFICIDIPGEPCVERRSYGRLGSVTSSAGYSLSVTYASNAIGAGPDPNPDWFERTQVTFNNSANPPSPQPAISYAYPNSTTTNVTDPGGRTWVFTVDASNRLTGVKRPGSGSNNISYAYGADGTVSSATVDGVTATYARSVVGSTATETVTDALSGQTVVVSDLVKARPTSYRDPLLRTTAYQYDANARLTRTTEPEGNYTQLAYDARGNVTSATRVAKSGSGLANIVTSASYDATCANIVKCNKPNSTTDAKGFVTDYVYNATHGGITSVTRPAPTTGAVRPQTRYSYTQVTSASGQLIYMLTGVSACQTTASCTGAADESKATLAYNSNLLPTSLTRANGTGSVTSTSTMTYYPRGQLNTVDGPRTGTADTSKYRYDSADQLIGVTSPDPDGAGALKMRAIRLTYRPDGQVSKQELGTVNSQSDADWALFAPLQTVDLTFNTNSRPITAKLSSGATAYALTQTSYDALGRVDCIAVRMNTAVYGSLPASACTLSTEGAFGKDRIQQTVYDAASQLIQNKVAVGTTEAATERTLTYSANSMLATLKDAENNLTTYEYDGHDRLLKTRFPLPTKGANASSTTDYEQFTYDLNSNVTAFRNRAAQSTSFTYDNLDRATLKNLPGTEPDVTYAYDNLGRLTSASQTGNSLSFTYDALSRNLTQAGPNGTATLAYDAAGRRTSIAYPAGGTALTLTYTWLVTGELTAIKQGATSLAAWAYDNLGSRTSLTFANGVVQAFGFDPVSRLTSLTNNLSGTASDLTKTYAYNPASQITTETRSNDSYAFVQSNVSETGIANGLNQLTSYAGKTLTYDTKGNVTGFGTDAFVYSSENLLTSATVGGTATTLTYDPLLRLYQTTSGATTGRFAYDGLDAIAEYNGAGTLQRRFVFDPTGHPSTGSGQPLVWYEGTGTAAADRRYLSADERGSVISVSDSTGASLAVNSYDEYGLPSFGALANQRFGYTGQMWLGSAQLWYYKARMYAPQIGGRFLQPDPIGYASGPNLYAYVGNDPINFTDPLGLDQTITVTCDPECQARKNPPPYTADPHAQFPVDALAQQTIVVTGQRIKKKPATKAPAPPPAQMAPLLPLIPAAIAAGEPASERTDRCSVSPDDPGGVDLSEACRQHDECYATPGSRGQCDWKLFNDVYVQCRRQGGDAATCGVLAFTYYLGVRLGGGLFRPFSRRGP